MTSSARTAHHVRLVPCFGGKADYGAHYEQWLLERMGLLQRGVELPGESEMFFMSMDHTYVCMYIHVYIY